MNDTERLDWMARMLADSLSCDSERAALGDGVGEIFNRHYNDACDAGKSPEDAMRAGIDSAIAAGAVAVDPARGPGDAEDLVRIWSGEHRAYWGPDRSGYFADVRSAGIYRRIDAEATTRACGLEKQIELRPLSAADVPGHPLERR